MTGDNFSVTARWGHYGVGESAMPRQGWAVERALTTDDRTAMDAALPALGEATFDIYLNDEAFWRNIPAVV